MLVGAFPESNPNELASLVTHMVASGFLMDSDGLLQIGPTTESQYGRAHYRDLLASFSGVQLLLGRFGKAEVVYIDPLMLAGQKSERVILLAGKSWRVVDVDWKRQTVWLEPAREGGNARWTGSGRALSRAIAQAIGRALQEGAGEHTVLSKRAQDEIARLAQIIPTMNKNQNAVLDKTDVRAVRLWTFGGTRANRTLAKQLAPLTDIRRIDALGLDVCNMFDKALINVKLGVDDLSFTADEIAEWSKPIKFAECLPRIQLLAIIRARQFERPVLVANALASNHT